MKYTGICWIGPVYDMGGYGNVSRNYLRAIETLGLPVYIHPVGGFHHRQIGRETVRWLEKLSTPHIGNRICVIRHGTPEMFEQIPVPFATRNIGVTIFETDRIPAKWVELCNRMDEVWVPSAFNYATFAGSGVERSKLRIVPYAIDTETYYPGRPVVKSALPHVPEDRFLFLYTFGFDYRKGFDLLIRSFCSEFAPHEKAALVLKVYIHSGERPEAVKAELESHIPSGPGRRRQIYVLIDRYTPQQLIQLYQRCDVYVTLDRGNGWGMPTMENMALGKAAISIGWGGCTEYMNENNSFLIEPEPNLVPVDRKLQDARPHLYRNHRWAEVKQHSVQRVLRYVFENKAHLHAVGRKAALDMHLRFSPGAIGAAVGKCLGL